MIGSILHGRWRILAELGRGGMGEVWLAEHLELGRKEALKILKPQAAKDPQFVSRFRREARAVNRLRHPNIVALHDFGQLPDERFYIAMEYAEGPTLYELLRLGPPFAVSRALHVLAQLAYALHHAHSRSVLHRDLKPANLMLVGADDTLKVLDFGMAKIIAGDTSESIALSSGNIIWGTAKYMSPERVTGTGDDPRTDLYAIGCIATELLTGTAPFTGTPSAIIDAHLGTAPPVPSSRRPELPRELDAVVLRLLEKKPDRRYASAAELFAALRRVPGYPTPRPEPRRRYVPVERSPEELTSDSLDDKYGNMRGALRQVAEVLLDLGADDTQLLGRLAAFRDHERSLARLEAAQDALEHEATAVRETVGDRESSLRFALGELRFVASERPEDLERSHELEVRLQTAVADADRANALDESIMSVAALRAENLDRLRIAYDALLGVVDDILPEFATNPALAPLVERLDAVRARRK
jgi:serine/threonine protein kinase